MAAAPKRPRALSTLEATAASASRTGDSSMIRVRRTVSSVVTASKPGVMIGTICGAKIGDDDRQAEQDDEHHVEHRRHDSPGALVLVAAEQPGQDRDHGRAQRTRGDQLEDRVGHAEGREIGVELSARTKLVGDDHDADVAQDARHEKGDGNDQAGAGQGAPAHGLVEPADPDDRGCA